MSATLYVVRHAETELGRRNIVNGDPSVANPLTARGREQARELRERLEETHFALCITTEFERTEETAALILEGRSVPRLVVPDLNDPRQGDFEGKDFAGYAAWMDDSTITDEIPGGGESQLDCVTRYARGWRTVADRADRNVLVVAHAFPISVALTLHEDDPPLLLRSYDRDPAFAEVNVLGADRILSSLDILDEELAAFRNAG